MPRHRANELLGYPPDARLLIINADDFGMYHAVNDATLRAFRDGIVHSTSLMTPCPWALHAMRLLRENPDLPFGVHLTIVRDFDDYRWGPLAPRDKVPSLLDATGSFHRNEPGQPFLAAFALDELEVEFRAQIETVLAAGLKPTHLDWHCMGDDGRPDIFELTFGLAREYGLALRISSPAVIERLQQRGLPTNDHDVLDSYRLETAGKTDRYVRMLRDLPVGLSEWAVHPSLGNAESRAIDDGWQVRKADFDFLTSHEAHETVRQEGIILLDYRALQAVWNVEPVASR